MCQSTPKLRATQNGLGEGLEPMSSNSLRLASTTKQRVSIDLLKKQYMTLKRFACRIFIFGSLLKSNNEVRQDTPDFLTSKSLIVTYYRIRSRNIFSLHIFCLVLTEQVIDLRKVRIENLNFRTDLSLQDLVMGGWSVSQ